MSILVWMRDRDERLEQERNPAPPMPLSPETSLFSRQQLWVRCESCGTLLYISHLKHYLHMCKNCGANTDIDCNDRIESLIDPDSWRPMDELLSPVDPLKFEDKKPYEERLDENQERTGFQDAVQTGTGLIHGIPVALGVMVFDFMAGSMGSVVGEKIARLIEYATRRGLSLILVCASGGARMQEGTLSLMQMAKIASCLFNHQCCARLFYISILASPTTGGVTASFAMLGDVVIAEPKAVVAFAGRRVIEQTLRETLPDDFQTAEYLKDHGLVDLILNRKVLKQVCGELLSCRNDANHKKHGWMLV